VDAFQGHFRDMIAFPLAYMQKKILLSSEQTDLDKNFHKFITKYAKFEKNISCHFNSLCIAQKLKLEAKRLL